MLLTTVIVSWITIVTFEIQGLDKLKDSMSKMVKQMDYAMSRTLNDLAFEGKRALENEILHGMKVRQNTSKAFIVDKSKKSDLVATIRLKKDWHKYPIPQHFKGGDSLPIGFERAMIQQGYMTNVHSAIPTKKMGRARYKSIFMSTRKKKKVRHSKYFVVPVNNTDRRTMHLHPGIYLRMKYKPRPVMLFTSEAQYRKRFDMEATVGKVVKRRASKYFFKYLDAAMRTAR